MLQRCLHHIEGEENHAILYASAGNYAWAWQTHFGREHDPSQVLGELNLFRYRPCRVLLRIDDASSQLAAAQVILAAATSGAPIEISTTSAARWAWVKELALHLVEEDETGLIARLAEGAMVSGPQRIERLRLLVSPSMPLRQAANRALVHVIDAPVLANGRLELRHYLREQVVSQTVHRYGNLMRVYAQPRSERDD